MTSCGQKWRNCIYGPKDIAAQMAGVAPTQTQQTEYKQGTAEIPKQEARLKQHDNKTNKDRLESILKFLERSEELDIYQLVAFRVKCGNKPTENGAFWGYYIDIVKALIIMLTQIVSSVILYIKIFNDRNKGYCDGNGEFVSRVMTTCYSAFLAMIIYTTWLSTTNAGFYLNVGYERKHYRFISSFWLHVGRTINEMTLASAYILSFFLILLTDDPLDMVLNGMALLFITEIDNAIVDSSDYLKVLSWFKDIKKKADSHSNGDDYVEAVFETEDMNGCIKKIYFIVTVITIIVMQLSVIASPALPILMYICY